MASEKPQQKYQELLAQKIIEAFKVRNIEGVFCSNKEEALSTALGMMGEGSVVSCGGSATLGEIGLIDALRGGDYQFLDPNGPSDATGKEQVAHQALQADFYLMSSNAITQSGELVNADGIGNRVAALAFGPRNVIVIAGMNKVEPDLDAAIRRVKTKAAQMILLKFKNDYETFEELEEAADHAYSQLVVTNRSVIPGRLKVILVGEDLGF